MTTTYQTRQNGLYDAIMGMGAWGYWPLGGYEQYQTGKYGYQDHSGNSRDLAPQGSPTMGGGGKLTQEPVDSSTQLNGTSQYFTSSVDPFTTGQKMTVFCLAQRLGGTTGALWGSGGPDEVAFLHTAGGPDTFRVSINDDVHYYTNGGIYDKHANELDLSTASRCFGVMLEDAASITNAPWVMVDDAQQTYSQIQFQSAYGTTGNFQVGAVEGANLFNGYMSHVAVFMRELSRREYMALFHAAYRAGWGGSGLMNWIARIVDSGNRKYFPMNAEYGAEEMGGQGASYPKGETPRSMMIGRAPSISPDLRDSATEFTGANAFKVPTDSQFVPFSGASPAFTLWGIARRNNSSSTHTIFGTSNTSTPASLRLLAGGNDVRFQFDGTNGYTFSGAWPGNNVNVGWILRRDGFVKDLQLIVNGTYYQAGAGLDYSFSSPGDLWFGKHGVGAGEGFEGLMSHMGYTAQWLPNAELWVLEDAVWLQPPGRIIEAAG